MDPEQELEETRKRLLSMKMQNQQIQYMKKLTNLSPKKPRVDSRFHKNLVRVGQSNVHIHEWLKARKFNRHERREPEDMVPIHYEEKQVWDVVSDVILLPKSDDSLLFGQEVANYKMGMKKN